MNGIKDFGQLLYKSPVGSQSIVAYPINSRAIRSLLDEDDLATAASKHGADAYAVVFYSIQSVYDKRKHKKAKKRAKLLAIEPAPAADGDDAEQASNAEPAAAGDANEPEEPKEERQPEPEPEPEPPIDYKGELLSTMQTTRDVVGALPQVQTKIVKFLMSNLYTQVLEGLKIDANGNPVTAADNDDDAAEAGTEVQPQQQRQQLTGEQVVQVLRESMRSVVFDYVAKNQLKNNDGDDENDQEEDEDEAIHPGTLRSVQASFGATLPALQQYLQHVDVQLQQAQSSAESERELAAMRDKLAVAERKLAAEKRKREQEGQASLRMAEKQLEVTEAYEKAQKQLAKASSDNEKLAEKVKELETFEQGANMMRKLLDSEVEAKNDAIQAFDDLSQLQARFKLTWVPPDACSHCLGCGDKFRMFGSKSKQHCRYCGRHYCKPCSKYEIPLPELGYSSKVRVCNGCFKFKRGVHEADTSSRRPDSNNHGDDDDDSDGLDDLVHDSFGQRGGSNGNRRRSANIGFVDDLSDDDGT
eukprot:TRINITY_DN12638_c0_g2_i1.p1 TRINITY_DN12638_c0_g2~~TRINITY_DN12638_c0_g2_i1.p1  ORF type:complete len:584 (+),score=304.62 TRINITY_DN12638_c0_g2_i1:166-1752(+)